MSWNEQAVIDHVVRQRWYGAKSREVAHANVLDSVVLRTAEPQFALAIVEMRYDTGAHDIYQLLYALREGSIELDGLEDATLGILQEFVRGGLDGWELALDELAGDPDRFLARLHRLGEVSGEMHRVLASDAGDPVFCAEAPSVEALGLLTATVDEEIERIFLALPDDEDALEPIAGRGEEVREHLRMLTYTGDAGQYIRTHGDYHLGQTMWAGDDWVILDFEGEPARSLAERRRKRSPLRDVAGMLRSFAYASNAVSLLRGVYPPDGWEERARSEFLSGYFETVDSSLLPAGQAAIERLLAVFELEKAVYELQYELNNRPDWVAIPVRGIQRLIEESSTPA